MLQLKLTPREDEVTDETGRWTLHEKVLNHRVVVVVVVVGNAVELLRME